MSDTKILQTILDKVSVVDKKVDKIDQKIDGVEERLTKRIDKQSLTLLTHRKIGLQVARLEDDTPTTEDFEKLERKVTKLQKQVAKN